MKWKIEDRAELTTVELSSSPLIPRREVARLESVCFLISLIRPSPQPP